MSCSVAVSNSPVFSPSSSLFCTKPSLITSSSETLTLSLSHLKPSNSSTTLSPSPSSPSSPFRLRLPKPPSVIFVSSSVSSSSNATSPNGTVLKRKRPTKLDIPVSSLTFGVPATPSAVARDAVEDQGDGYSVYCKRGRREYMEDRYTAKDNLRGEHKLVFFFSFFTYLFNFFNIFLWI